MSELNFNNSQREHLTVPLEAPPAYEPKPEDETDVEQNATQDNHSNITKKLISRRFFVSFALVVLSLWFTMLVLDAAGVRRSGVIYSDRHVFTSRKITRRNIVSVQPPARLLLRCSQTDALASVAPSDPSPHKVYREGNDHALYTFSIDLLSSILIYTFIGILVFQSLLLRTSSVRWFPRYIVQSTSMYACKRNIAYLLSR
ncbi:uncharacterized protein FOMMEDRAFT_165569, partial [Fomitiporia mediterranea MF3/22]|uniref:uncharacterized protein n=1 Tax=Fomitiporia mediterranea (strain MF3/22) TaxID=694068 RepID=UPI0004409BA1